MTRAAHLCAPEYVLGEHRHDYRDTDVLIARAAELGLPQQPEVWGWGAYHRTERSVADLAADSARRTVKAAGVSPEDVDAIIVCTTTFPGSVDGHGPYLADVLACAGLPSVAFACGLTLNRCNNLLAALALATALVRSGGHRTVLVVTADRAADEAQRLDRFALFSDGAASCLVSDRPLDGPAFAVLGCTSEQDVERLGADEQIDARLAARVTGRLCGAAGIEPSDIAALLPANLVRPVLSMKERLGGMTAEQVVTDNIERVGHCFAADPVINLADLVAARGTAVGGHYLLAASVSGARHAILLRRTT